MDIGDRMKAYEANETQRKLLRFIPVYARLDGRNFHSYTREMERPYDLRLSDTFYEVTRTLVKESGAIFGYTQSDEINLLWFIDQDNYHTEMFFDGKISKLTSVMSSMCTAYFNDVVKSFKPRGYLNKPAMFDCRVLNLPTQTEAANMILWRTQDAVRNSLMMACLSKYSHKDMLGKNTADQHEMLFRVGINFNDYPPIFKQGSFFQKEGKFINMPIFSKISNREEVIFKGLEPVIFP